MSFTSNPWTVNPWTTALFAANPWAKDDLFRFTNTSGTLNPSIVVTGTPDILWTWSDGTTDTNADPADVTCVGENTLYVSDWDTIERLYFNTQNLTGKLETKEWLNATYLIFDHNDLFDALGTRDWHSVERLYFQHNSFTGDIQVKEWPNAISLLFHGNGFSSMSGSLQTQIKMAVCQFDGNAITSSAQIDKALSDLVVNAGAAGRSATCAVNFSGGTNSGPTAAGTASRETLVTTHSWTVTINPEV